MITIALAYTSNLVRTAQAGMPDGSAPRPPDVAVCPTTYAAEVKANNVDKSFILKSQILSSFSAFIRGDNEVV